MPRVPVVSRTIKTTEVTVMCLDIEAGEPMHRDVTLCRTYKSESDMLKAAAPIIEKAEPNLRAVHIARHEVKETLYAMPEQEFVAHAKPIQKPIKDENEANNENE